MGLTTTLRPRARRGIIATIPARPHAQRIFRLPVAMRSERRTTLPPTLCRNCSVAVAGHGRPWPSTDIPLLRNAFVPRLLPAAVAPGRSIRERHGGVPSRSCRSGWTDDPPMPQEARPSWHYAKPLPSAAGLDGDTGSSSRGPAPRNRPCQSWGGRHPQQTPVRTLRQHWP